MRYLYSFGYKAWHLQFQHNRNDMFRPSVSQGLEHKYIWNYFCQDQCPGQKSMVRETHTPDILQAL